MQQLRQTLEKSPEEVLSVQQNKHLKSYLKNFVTIGISTKLLPNLPLYIKPKVTYDNEDIFYNYNILKTTTLAICDLLKFPILRLVILPDNLRLVLISCYQIAYCPLKKPSPNIRGQFNVVTERKYQKLCREQQDFIELLDHLEKTIHPSIFVKETMATFYSNTPPWFKKSVSQNLTSIVTFKNGLESIVTALLDGASNDSTQTWKILDVISKLIVSCRSFPNFKQNVGSQLEKLVLKVAEDSLIYERIYIHCTKRLYKVDPELAKDVLVRPFMLPFLYLTYSSHKFENNENITKQLKQSVRLLYSLYVENNVELKKLSVDLLTPIAEVLFRIFTFTLNTSFKCTSNELKDLVLEFIKYNLDKVNIIFDCFLFSIPSEQVLPIRKDITVIVSDKDVILNSSAHSVSYSISESSEALLELLGSKIKIKVKLFSYLLNCLVDKEKYLKKANEELMLVEEKYMNEHLEKTLTVYKLLAELVEDKNVQEAITEEPGEIIKYMVNVLQKSLELNTHKGVVTDSEAYQSLFTVLMILQSLVGNCTKTNMGKYQVFIEPLRKISEETSDKETRNIIKEVQQMLDKGSYKSTRMYIEEVKSELDKALEDICDPLLPVRGHGLMTLSKLVERKDANVMERKQYVLNIFQVRKIVKTFSFIVMTFPFSAMFEK